MAGVLLWIGLLVGAASRRSDKVLKKWFSALAVRCSILLCFEHPEAMHATVLRMSEFVEGVGFARGEEVGRRATIGPARPAAGAVRSASASLGGKRRKV
jgi:hypothetical protein